VERKALPLAVSAFFSVATHEHMCDTATGEKACVIGGVGFGLRFEAEDGEENNHQESRQVHL